MSQYTAPNLSIASLNGTAYAYRRFGRQNTTPVVFLQHSRGNLDNWDPARGADVGADGVARFDRSGLIRLVAGAPRRRHVLTLLSSDPGLRAFTFTFGS